MSKIIFYSDNFIINENENGFVFRFFKDKTETEEATLYDVDFGMSPLSAKEFLFALYNAVGEFEKKHGEIKFDPGLLRRILKRVENPIGFELKKSE